MPHRPPTSPRPHSADGPIPAAGPHHAPFSGRPTALTTPLTDRPTGPRHALAPPKPTAGDGAGAATPVIRMSVPACDIGSISHKVRTNRLIESMRAAAEIGPRPPIARRIGSH
ncbi:hypothetical protein GCM10023335_08460 [Streptomyces siamensis]|uniref:Uncharacterized protein n=1 Tax=Streptomyces siamensis TaxID=1274986 RepID=A0ABP9IID5_9ACTN